MTFKRLCLVHLSSAVRCLSSVVSRHRPLLISYHSPLVTDHPPPPLPVGRTTTTTTFAENLISDFLTDAGDRLKKSKQNSLRQIKQTLRFGRRSDPMLAPTFDEHQAAPASFYELTNTNNQRLLADALAGDN